jgi:mannose-6-phosphate isomerase-like protein (cupin superfamily)
MERPTVCALSGRGESGRGAVGAAPHYHHGRDEFFYVLEGEVVLRVGDESHTARAGTFAFVPRQTIHGFHNPTSESATLLVMHHPAGFESFFEEMQQWLHGGEAERNGLPWLRATT